MNSKSFKNLKNHNFLRQFSDYQKIEMIILY